MCVDRAVKTLADGSQQEISMDTIMFKSAEETKGGIAGIHASLDYIL